jgi:acetyltransferase-like isoleucine patch superfamily enzyme
MELNVMLNKIKRLWFKVLLLVNTNPRLKPRIYSKFLKIKIGEGCEIHGKVNFGSEPWLISIGDKVRITDNVRFITHDGGIWVIRNKNSAYRTANIYGPIKIGNNVHIGTNSIILPNVSIGNNCIIGVGSIVTKDVPDNSVAAGVPCKVIRSVDEYLEKNMSKIIHKSITYKKEDS